MQIASKHLQSSIVAGFVVLCGLTIGFASAETSALPSFALSFVQITPNNITDGPFAAAKFDIGGYVSHPCYQIAGMEKQTCLDQYGLSESLKTYIDNGSLLSYLRANGLATAAVAVVESSSSSSSVESSASSISSQASSVMNTPEQVGGIKLDTPSTVTTHVLNSTVVTQADFERLRQNRSNELWAFCTKQFRTRYEVAACFQRNMSILMRLKTPIEGNVQ